MADQASEVCEVPKKKPHLEVSNKEDIKSQVSIHKDLKDLSNFTIDRVLSCNSNRKTITLQGTFAGSSEVGIVLLEKSAFDETKVRDEDFLGTCSLKQDFFNDIYGNYECFPKVELNGIKTTIIHPATEKHIERYGAQLIHILNETPDIYKEIVVPSLKDSTQFTLQWVYNILEHKSEHGKIVFEDDNAVTGFILLPDLKWDGKTVETLYLLAIPHLRGIKSLRDLTAEHLPLLRNIYDSGTKTITEKYNINSSRLRVYFHYQPSFYHLHVHFTTLQVERGGMYAEQCHLLANVISNIELVPDYYQRVTLPCAVRENDLLFKQFAAKGLLKKVSDSNQQEDKNNEDVGETCTN